MNNASVNNASMNADSQMNAESGDQASDIPVPKFEHS